MDIPLADSVSNLIASFNFRRAVALISILAILGGAAWTVDYYSDFSRLSRLERATSLLERLEALEKKPAGQDLSDIRGKLTEELSAIVTPKTGRQRPGDSNAFKDWLAEKWKKFSAGALPWFLLSLSMLPGVFRREKNSLAGFFAFQFLTAFFGFVVGAIPPVGSWLIDYLIIPLGLLVVVAVVPMSIASIAAFKKVRESSLERAITNNLRQLSAAADQYFLEHGRPEVSVSDLVGLESHKYIKVLTSVDGESYENLVIRQGEPISVVRRNGERVTYSY